MKFLNVIDCNGYEHNINTVYIYDLTSEPDKEGDIITIHLKYIKDEQPFITIKTHESIASIKMRLSNF